MFVLRGMRPTCYCYYTKESRTLTVMLFGYYEIVIRVKEEHIQIFYYISILSRWSSYQQPIILAHQYCENLKRHVSLRSLLSLL